MKTEAHNLESASDVGMELGRFLRGIDGGQIDDDPESMAAAQLLMMRLMNSRADSALDVLAFLVLARTVIQSTMIGMKSAATGEITPGCGHLLDTAALLIGRSIRTIEHVTGYSGDGFSCNLPAMN